MAEKKKEKQIKVGTKLRKYFNGHGVFDGKVVSRTKERGTDSDLYRILYEDGDSEDCYYAEVAELLELDGKKKKKKQRRKRKEDDDDEDFIEEEAGQPKGKDGAKKRRRKRDTKANAESSSDEPSVSKRAKAEARVGGP